MSIANMTFVRKVIRKTTLEADGSKYVVALIQRDSTCCPYVVCNGYHEEFDEHGQRYAYWGSGTYFMGLEDAVECFKEKQTWFMNHDYYG